MANQWWRSTQPKHLVFVFLFSISLILLLYVHFDDEITKLSAAYRKLEYALARLQLDSLEHQRHDTTVSQQSIDSEDDIVVIYNRVPKTGSTSFMGVAYDLCSKNKFNVLHFNTTKNTHILSLADQARFVTNVTNWNAKKPALYHGHLAFIDFGRFGISKRPVFINIIRRPLDRLVSYYYFLRYGDNYRPHLIRRKQGDKMTFDECVEQQEEDCAPENMWLQIPFFCGHVADCWIPGNKWALQQAKHNLAQHYMLVGITEELQDFIILLEAALPRLFQGASELFSKGTKSHLRKTMTKIEPSAKTIAKIEQSTTWKMENEFYEFAVEQFHFIKKRTLILKDGMLTDRGRQFLFEKIRPK